MADLKTFSTVDYLVFVFTLLLSAGIGVYYAFTGGQQNTMTEIFLADRKMNPWPVAASLLASFMSAITLLGLSAEIYNFGWDYILINFAFIMVIFAANHFYLPVFYHLQVTSSYEYLERRFHRSVRVAGCVTFIIQMVFYLAIVLYAPALALNAVTGFSIPLSILSIGLVCTFYTTVGGMKAVIWTDAIQCIFMFAGIIAIIWRGAVEVGGLGVVFERAIKGKRMEMFSFNPSPFERHTVWSIIFGGFFTWLAIFGVNQAQVQRCLSCPTLKTSQKAMYINLPGLCALMTVCSFCGLVIYAIYWKCDPLTRGYIKSSDQLLPYVVMNIMNYPGIPGLFISSLFSGSLSTLSSGLNSLAAVVLEDIVKIYFYPKIPERIGSIVSKILATAFGIILIAFAFFSSLLGNILQVEHPFYELICRLFVPFEAALSIFGMVGGPLLGLFTLGMFIPWANTKGSLIGWITGMLISFWIGVGTSISSPPYPKRPLSVAECPDPTFSTLTTIMAMNQTMPEKPVKQIFILYWLSYLNLSFVSMAIVMIVGISVSYFTGFQDPDQLDPQLLSPPVRKLYCYLSKRFNLTSFRPGSPAALLDGSEHNSSLGHVLDDQADSTKESIAMSSTDQRGSSSPQ